MKVREPGLPFIREPASPYGRTPIYPYSTRKAVRRFSPNEPVSPLFCNLNEWLLTAYRRLKAAVPLSTLDTSAACVQQRGSEQNTSAGRLCSRRGSPNPIRCSRFVLRCADGALVISCNSEQLHAGRRGAQATSSFRLPALRVRVGTPVGVCQYGAEGRTC